MATLTNDDFTWIRQNADKVHKDTIKFTGLSKTALQATYQAIEDWHVNGFSVAPSVSMRSAMETAASDTFTVSEAQALWLTWSKWKASNY